MISWPGRRNQGAVTSCCTCRLYLRLRLKPPCYGYFIRHMWQALVLVLLTWNHLRVHPRTLCMRVHARIPPPMRAWQRTHTYTLEAARTLSAHVASLPPSSADTNRFREHPRAGARRGGGNLVACEARPGAVMCGATGERAGQGAAQRACGRRTVRCRARRAFLVRGTAPCAVAGC